MEGMGVLCSPEDMLLNLLLNQQRGLRAKGHDCKRTLYSEIGAEIVTPLKNT